MKYLLILTAFFVYSFVSVAAKLAAQQGVGPLFFFFIGMELFLLAVYALLWQQVLKRFSLVSAMSFKGLVVVLGLLWAFWLFNESIAWHHLFGTVLIVAGIFMIAGDKINE